MSDPTQVPSFKVVLLGESAVGKTSLILRYMRDSFSPDSASTIGASFLSREMEVDNKRIDVALWDTAGQEMYRSLTPMYYRNAHAAIVVFDVGTRHTFEQAKEWIDNVRYHNDDAIISLCGNMIDKETRDVSRHDADELAESKRVSYHETSAKTGVGVEAMFENVIQVVVANANKFSDDVGDSVVSSRAAPKRPKNCC